MARSNKLSGNMVVMETAFTALSEAQLMPCQRNTRINSQSMHREAASAATRLFLASERCDVGMTGTESVISAVVKAALKVPRYLHVQ